MSGHFWTLCIEGLSIAILVSSSNNDVDVIIGIMIDACQRIMNDKEELLGVLCMSFLSSELFGVSTDFTESENAYRFLIDDTGNSLHI